LKKRRSDDPAFRAYQAKWHSAYSKRHRAAGRCRCGKVRVSGSTQCEQCRDRVKAYNKKYREAFRVKALEAYGGKCHCCGEAEFKFLELHHKNHDGAEHRRTVSGARGSFTKWLLDNGYPEIMDILCANCHTAVTIYGKCPHREKTDE
jgi:hypothetical protein